MTERSPNSISSLLALRLPKAGNTKLVAVDGHGGAGKSTFAELLAQALNTEVVHTDDFASWDNPKHWLPNLIERVLQPVAAGAQTLNYPTFQLVTGP
jgi:energy-coupling factor transporter ATP-binding protein EcfA2